ncbi:amidohydrolase [Opitutales bacterium ASA1]|uniref:amidohydrolase family protein n=1 Tax=Congregicoccus parvus TaxID=3081749 RepID=UPI002B30E033|nr:amidohydrolase [Opitutales bacterium ASA1]
MPDFPIVDTHLHLWDLDRLSYPWLDHVPVLRRNHLLTDYREACGPVQVAKMVFLQCECDFARFEEEAAWIASLASVDPRIRGIVPWAPLEKGDTVEGDLERLVAIPLVRGIRRIIQFEPDPEFCVRPDFVRGVRTLPRFGLSFDLCVKCHQLPNTIELVRRCPEVRFVLDHIGKPNIARGELDPWRTHVRELAAFPNVWCKVSGLATEADFEHWTPADLRPYLDHAFACFGFDRTMFGGDWPVSTQATTYPRWVETLDAALEGASPDELHRLYVRNAEAFYRV